MAKPRHIKHKILELSKNGVNFYQISKILHCSIGTVSYHLIPGNKEKAKFRQIKYREQSPIHLKIETFNKPNDIIIFKIRRLIKSKIRTFDKKEDMLFNEQDLLAKIGDNPICYLTGTPINLLDSKSYQLDHIIPKSKGGDNSLENCGLAISEANRSKCDLLIEEYLILCEKVLIYNGYVVQRPNV